MKKTLPPNAITVPDSATLVFKGKIFDVYQWQQELFDGSHATFEMLKRPDTVQIVAIKDGKLILVNDEQPNREAQLHFPGGRADEAGETWLEAAKREMLEETGMKFKTWRLIEVYQPMIKIEQFVPWFLATDFESQGEQHLDAGEKITVEEKGFDEIRALIMDGRNSTMNYAIPLFLNVKSVDELLALPEFQGKEADR
jgi:ADP-ribose pyrophosphatase